MCDCCKEVSGWCRSFTKIEICLSILQGVLLLIFILCLTFLILHLHACFKLEKKHDVSTTTATTTLSTESEAKLTTQHEFTTMPPIDITNGTTVKCTWTPSNKTTAATHYYLTQHNWTTTSELNVENKSKETTYSSINSVDKQIVKDLLLEDFDSVEADDLAKSFVLALVKIKSSTDLVFGCTLSIISKYWTLTAASCIEAIEEVDALDFFVMMEGLGEKRERVHTVSDVFLHPQYQGTNYSFDLAALKSEDRLTHKGQIILTISTIVDYLLIPIGEHLTCLGHGKYRNFDEEPRFRRVHFVSVHKLPWQQCDEVEGAEGKDEILSHTIATGSRMEYNETQGVWSPRHLVGGHALCPGSCAGEARDARGVCAGSLQPRDELAACGFCGGSALLRGARTLVAVRDGRNCGACAPASFVPLAPHRSWILSVITAQ